MPRFVLYLGIIAIFINMAACGSSDSSVPGGQGGDAGAGGTTDPWDAGHGGSAAASGKGGAAGQGGKAATGGSSGTGGTAGSAGDGGGAGTAGVGGQAGSGGTGGTGGIGGTGGAGNCSHDLCAQGVALAPDCAPCTTTVCNADPYCCAGAWDEQCVGKADNLCGLNCPLPPCTASSCPTGCCDPTDHCYPNECQIYGVACGKGINPGTGTGNCDQCNNGTCYTCDAQNCVPCVPQCAGKACGESDGCGARCEGPCPAGQFCSMGLAQCTNVCDALSCPLGCCDGAGKCVSGQNDTACGSQGDWCTACSAGNEACLPVHVSNQKSPGGKCGQCDSTTCPTGCCTSDGHCIDVLADNACGREGAGCVDCTLQGSLCIYGGMCVECMPKCDGKTCGDSDGCGGSCKVACGTGLTCVVGSSMMKGGCYPCGPGTCDGCCTSQGECVSGGLRSQCGGQGKACQDCGDQACTTNTQTWPFTPQCSPCGSNCQPPVPGMPAMCQADGCGGVCPGSSCAGNPGPGGDSICQITKDGWAQCMPSGFCDPYMCGGCCGYAGWNSMCEPGNLPSKCGSDGHSCVDCISMGTTCDVATRKCAGCVPTCGGAMSCGQADLCGGTCTAASAGKCGADAACTDEGKCECTTPGMSLCYDASYSQICISTDADPNNCGGCNRECPTGVACVNGACACPVGKHYCQQGQGSSTAEAACTDLATDPAHCGSCQTACPGTPCVHGVCGACPTATTSCPYSNPPACANLTNDNNNCGSCGVVCPAGNPCVNGYCDCGGGKVSCNGTCIDVLSDPQNCGQCYATCPNGVPCQGGTCVCPGGTTLCAGQCTNTQVDPNHCGKCGMICMPGQSCSAGTCQ